MAIKKQVREANGIITEYHRIAMIKMDTNQQCSILIVSYLNEEGRQYEKDYASGHVIDEPIFPYTSSRYISTNYYGNLSIGRAYDWIKTNLPEYKDAEDVFDSEEQTNDIDGYEFMSMLEGVL